MNLQQLEKIFPRLVEAKDPASGKPISREFISPPGRGKSSFIKQMVRKMSRLTGVEWGLSTTFIATSNPMTMMGYDMPQKRISDGKLVSCFIDPFWMTTDREWGERPMSSFQRGIWLLDEWDKGEADVKKLSAEGFLNGRVGPHWLPEGWLVMACSNRAKDRSGSTKNYDFIINRREEIHVSDDLDSLNRWMDLNNIHPTIKTFVARNPQIVFQDLPELQGPWPTPRSIMMAAGELEALSGKPGELALDATANELCTGIIGTAATAQLFATIRLQDQMPEFADIMKNPTTCKIPKGLDAQMLVCYHLAALVEEEHLASAITYIERMPSEFSIVFVKAASGRNQDFVLTKAFGDWSIKNAAILAAVESLK